MDILRNLFGALTSGIIRLLVTVGILAAVYFFIVRPVLDTTSDAIREANNSVKTLGGGTGQSFRIDSTPGFSVKVDGRAGQKLVNELQRSFAKAQRRGELPQLTRCIQRSGGNVKKIRRCARKI